MGGMTPEIDEVMAELVQYAGDPAIVQEALARAREQGSGRVNLHELVRQVVNIKKERDGGAAPTRRTTRGEYAASVAFE